MQSLPYTAKGLRVDVLRGREGIPWLGSLVQGVVQGAVQGIVQGVAFIYEDSRQGPASFNHGKLKLIMPFRRPYIMMRQCNACVSGLMCDVRVPSFHSCRPMGPSSQVCCAVLCCAVLCCAVLCCAVLCCAVLCCAVLCCAVLCCVVLG